MNTSTRYDKGVGQAVLVQLLEAEHQPRGAGDPESISPIVTFPDVAITMARARSSTTRAAAPFEDHSRVVSPSLRASPARRGYPSSLIITESDRANVVCVCTFETAQARQNWADPSPSVTAAPHTAAGASSSSVMVSVPVPGGVIGSVMLMGI